MSVTTEEEEEDAALFSDNTNNHNQHDDNHCEVSENSENDDLSASEYDDDDEDEDDDGHLLPPRPISQHTFAPPFYGRPPTPLPPSPSLTSLLRPSRPTTPDASDDDGPEPVPRASPKVPTYEYYGFVLYLFSSLCFLIYLLWSYLPSPFLHALGIYYYPNRWWSLAIPSFLVMLLVYIYVALAAYNTEIMTLPLSSIETIVDDAAQIAVVDSKGRIIRADKRGGDKSRRNSRDQQHQSHHHHRKRTPAERERERELLLPGGGLNWNEIWNEGTDAVMDIPLAGVCEVLYGEGKRRREGGGRRPWDYDEQIGHDDGNAVVDD